jgi:hypothetical protein
MDRLKAKALIALRRKTRDWLTNLDPDGGRFALLNVATYQAETAGASPIEIARAISGARGGPIGYPATVIRSPEGAAYSYIAPMEPDLIDYLGSSFPDLPNDDPDSDEGST